MTMKKVFSFFIIFFLVLSLVGCNKKENSERYEKIKKEVEKESELADKDLISAIEINKQCNDCGKKDPRWCSINNAVFLCSTCARTHKKFNQEVSTIKSLEVDPWTKQEINFEALYNYISKKVIALFYNKYDPIAKMFSSQPKIENIRAK